MNDLTNMPSDLPPIDFEALRVTAQKLAEMEPIWREVRVNRWTFTQLCAVCDAGPGGPAEGLRGWGGLPVIIDADLADNQVEFRRGEQRKVVETKFAARKDAAGVDADAVAWCRQCETNVVLDGNLCPMCGRRLRADKDEAGADTGAGQ